MATIADIIDFSLPNNAAEDSFNLLELWTGQASSSPPLAIAHNTSVGKLRFVVMNGP